MPCTACTSGANWDAMRPLHSTIVRLPSGRTKNSMLNMLLSNPSAGISLAATSAIALRGPSGRRVGILESQKADVVRMHDRVGDADRRHPPILHPALECDQHPVEQLLRDQGAERPPSSARSAEVIASISSRRGRRRPRTAPRRRPGRPAGQVAATGFTKKGMAAAGRRRDRPARPRRTRRDLGNHRGLDAAARELVVAAHERVAPGAGQTGVVGEDRREMPGRVARPKIPSAAVRTGPCARRTCAVKARSDRLSGKAKREPIENPLIGHVQPVALAGADHQCGGHGAVHRPDVTD